MLNTIKYNLEKQIDEFMIAHENYEHSNFLSYDYCRKVFQESSLTSDMDSLALHLFAFLGSWGMFRGKGFLVYNDYKFLIPICKIVLNEKYKKLRLDIFDEHFCPMEYQHLIKEISEEIRNELVGKKYCKNLVEETINNVTDTFIAKILLVIFGCVPAFDEFGIEGMKKLSIHTQTLNNMSEILDFAIKNKSLLQKKQQEIEEKFYIKYSIMKLVDMIFWTIGRKVKIKE